MLLLDKSTIQALNYREVQFLDKYYSNVISPILMREMLSNLAKNDKDREEIERRLSILAANVDTSNSYVLPDAKSLAKNNLLEVQIPLDGRIPMTTGTIVRSKDGRTGAIFEEPPEKDILRKWKKGNFSVIDHAKANLIRKINTEVDLKSISEFISQNLQQFPSFNSFENIVKWVDEKFFPLTDQRLHIQNISTSLLPSDKIEHVIQRWESSGKPCLAEFAPYAFYFYRVNIIYFLGLGKGFISHSKNAKTHLDIQYIYYLPFCMAFTSGDKFLRFISSYFLRRNQFFLWRDELKADLKKIIKFWDGLSEVQKEIHREEYGIYPPEIEDSLTFDLWKKLMQPRPQKKFNGKDPKKSELNTMISAILKESVRITDNESLYPSLTEKYDKYGLLERSILLIEKCIEILNLQDKDWSSIKKEITSDHIKKIYSFYADIWRPDTNVIKLLKMEKNKMRSLYMGNLDPQYLVQDILNTLLYFDQICIVDPFHNPWAIKEEYNPISNPELYENNFLKLLNLLLSLFPWIIRGEILFIPDPTNFNPSFKLEFLNLSMEKSKNLNPLEIEKEDYKKIEKLMEEDFNRFLWRLPKDLLSAFLRKGSPDITPQEIDIFFKHCLKKRSEDPFTIDKTFKENPEYLSIIGSGVNLELSLILCQLMNALPSTNLSTRKYEYLMAKTKSGCNNPWKTFLDRFNKHKFKFFSHIAPSNLFYLKDKGYLRDFRLFLKEIFSVLQSSQVIDRLSIEEFTTKLDIELQKLDHEWQNIESELKNLSETSTVFELIDGKIFLDIEQNGYDVKGRSDLVRKYIGIENVSSKVPMFMHYSLDEL